MSVTSSAIGDGTWENNWLFRKKKFNSNSSIAVSSAGMLVPDPSEDVRAQIGDKTTDEVSDLSELGSDTDDSLDIIMRTKLEPINDRLANKHLIGGENDKIVLDELIKRSSIVSNTLPETPNESYTDTLNENVVDAPVMSEAINNNVNQHKTAMDNDNCDTADGISSPLDFEDINSNSLTGKWLIITAYCLKLEILLNLVWLTSLSSHLVWLTETIKKKLCTIVRVNRITNSRLKYPMHESWDFLVNDSLYGVCRLYFSSQ